MQNKFRKCSEYLTEKNMFTIDFKLPRAVTTGHGIMFSNLK